MILYPSFCKSKSPKFENIIDDFFPRYLNVLDVHKDNVEEVRIEGHTSTDWMGARSSQDAYFKNMALSQARTRAVLEYGLSIPYIHQRFSWARDKITANGLSSSRLIKEDEKENRQASRRVEFKIRTNAKQQVVKVLETLE